MEDDVHTEETNTPPLPTFLGNAKQHAHFAGMRAELFTTENQPNVVSTAGEVQT